ncbi:hypothetical protein [uncultured Roseibium sp.]|uniref:hypothetical protein n=1 Tax=uncultured Roseibium sp. TaxID=1936171 RepID=UPI003217B106
MTRAAQLLETVFLTLYRGVCRIYRPLRSWMGAAVLALLVITTAAVVHVFPVSNWDMVAYTASILEPEIADPVELHDTSYELLKKNVSPGEFLTLTQDRDYRIRQYEDPRAFSTMLGFYRLKVLYIETARVLTRFVDPVQALRLISIGSALAVGAVLMLWLARNGALMYGPVVAGLLVLSSFGASAALLSPDLYASVFILLAAYFYLERQDIGAALALIVAFFIRPDHLAFIGVFFVFAWIYGPGRWVMTACFAICLAGYVWLTSGSDHPGWWIHLWFTHVEYVPTLEGFHPPFSVLIYLKMLVRSTVRSIMHENWLALLFAQVLFFAKVIDPAILSERTKALLYGMFASICAKYLVFPHFETRFYFPYLMAMAMIMLIAWQRQEQQARTAKPA